MWVWIFFGSAHTCKQGLEKVLSSHPGQVDSPSGQVKFTVTCLFGKGSGNLCASEVIKTANKDLPGQVKFRATCRKGRLESCFFEF